MEQEMSWDYKEKLNNKGQNCINQGFKALGGCVIAALID